MLCPHTNAPLHHQQHHLSPRCLVAGDSRGCVDVYKIVGVDLMPGAIREEQAQRLRAVLTSDADA